MKLQAAMMLLMVLKTLVASTSELAHPGLPHAETSSLTPPALGYSTWNAYGGDITAKLAVKTIDLMVSSGLQKAGYKYFCLDDAWAEPLRDEEGRVLPHKRRFPDGVKPIADYAHSKGLLFGIYSDAGDRTCLGYPGSRFLEEQDARQFAAWGVDLLKYDNCNAPSTDDVRERYRAMGAALNATGRHIHFAMCSWGVGDPWLGWGSELALAQSWRTTEDVAPTWNDLLRVLDNSIGLSRHIRPGRGYNDMDGLEVGNGFLTLNEQRTQMSLWALFKSPLMVSADLERIPQQSLDLLTNAEVLAVNQDPSTRPGDLVFQDGPYQVFAANLPQGAKVVGFLNRHSFQTQYPLSNIAVAWSQLGWPDHQQVTVRDLWKHTSLGQAQGNLTVSVDIHDTRLMTLEPVAGLVADLV